MFILDFRKDAGEFINKFVIGFVSGIYKLVDYAYRVFMVLAKTNIFSEENFKDITSNIYKILAVAMLFILAYAILLKIVDPDGSTKGIDGKKTFQNFIIAIILIILCPSIFSFAYGLQSAILDSGIIGGIITGNVGDASSENVTNANIYGGILMSVNTFEVFFRPVGERSGSDIKGATNIGEIVASKPVLSFEPVSGFDGSSKDLYINCDGSQSDECSYDAAFLFAQNTGSFAPMKAFALNMYDNEIDFDWFAAFIVGLLLIYVIISFCFDMGIRVCKLAFFQMIAPIGIICMAIPKMEDVFKKWLSNTTKTYLSVFIRTLVMSFGVYLISLVAKNPLFSDETGGQTGVPIFNLMAKCFLIMGIVVFIKQSPKLLGDIFGIGDGDMKLGIKDKLKAGGAFAAGAAIGGATTGLVRNAVNAGQNFKKAPKDKKFGAVVKGIGSTLAGGASGFTKGVWYAKDAGSGKDMRNAASQAANKTVENRMKREAYKAAHPGFMGATRGHLEDAGDSALKWAGFNNIEALQKANAEMSKVSSKKKAMADAAESLIVGEANKNKDKTFGIDKSVQFDGGENLLAQQYNGQFNTSTLRKIRQKLDEAKATGSAKEEKDGKDVTAAEWENLYGSYLSSFKDAVQNQALLSKTSWDAISDSSVKADLSEVRNAANDFRNELGRHLNESFVVKSNDLSTGSKISAETLQEDIKINAGAFKEIGDQIKIAQSENYAQISKIQQKEQEKNGK